MVDEECAVSSLLFLNVTEESLQRWWEAKGAFQAKERVSSSSLHLICPQALSHAGSWKIRHTCRACRNAAGPSHSTPAALQSASLTASG